MTTRLINFTPPSYRADEWEIGYFDTDPQGLKLATPLLGVRVNGGTWMDARPLTEAFEKEMDKHDYD